jgi:hypothetical protein
MRRLSFLALLHCSICLADVQFPPAPAPSPKVEPAPVPTDASPKLRKHQYYVIKSDVPQVILLTGDGKATVKHYDGSKKAVVLPTDSVVGWPGDKDDAEFATFTDKNVYVVKGTADGIVNMQCIPAVNAVDAKGVQLLLKPTDIKYKTVQVELGTGPQPPPKPVDPPTPPKPKVEAPIKAPGLHVLIVLPKNKAFTSEQVTAFWGKDTNKWLEANCIVKPDGQKAYRIWYEDTDTSNAPKEWQDAMKLERKSLPWIVVSNGPDKGGTSESAPGTSAGLIKLMELYR